MAWSNGWFRVLAMAVAIGAASSAIAADGEVWRVSKSSGEVWMTTSGAQHVSLTQEEVLKAGDTVRTGRNGRVLLVRGEETILVSPNSVIGLPTNQQDGLSTTILQQAGSILLEVEKRNVQHFQVETPYLAAVVKGTKFSVSVNGASSSVEVLRGQVEVADFKSGQIAQVMPGQHATTFTHGKPGLSLGGSGTLNPIEQGKPRASPVDRLVVPKGGLSAPRNAANGLSTHALAPFGTRHSGIALGGPRISAALGEVKLDFHKVTHGLAHGVTSRAGSVNRTTDKEVTVGTTKGSAGVGIDSSSDSASGLGNGIGNGLGNGLGNGTGNGLGNGLGNGIGNGLANGIGNGLALGLGNGIGSGLANGNGRANGHHP
jgi:FecR protein